MISPKKERYKSMVVCAGSEAEIIGYGVKPKIKCPPFSIHFRIWSNNPLHSTLKKRYSLGSESVDCRRVDTLNKTQRKCPMTLIICQNRTRPVTITIFIE